MNKKNDDIDFLYIFPKYRRLRIRLNATNRDNRILRKNWQEQLIINDGLKEKLKQKNKIIKMLRKELKENATKKRHKTSQWTSQI